MLSINKTYQCIYCKRHVEYTNKYYAMTIVPLCNFILTNKIILVEILDFIFSCVDYLPYIPNKRPPPPFFLYPVLPESRLA